LAQSKSFESSVVISHPFTLYQKILFVVLLNYISTFVLCLSEPGSHHPHLAVVTCWWSLLCSWVLPCYVFSMPPSKQCC
jgi:hypothetical protein